MPKESREAKRARKAAARAAARDRAARIVAGEVPDYLRLQTVAGHAPALIKPRHKVVQVSPPEPAAALIPPTDAPLRSRDREHYADNAQPVWVKDGPDTQDD